MLFMSFIKHTIARFWQSCSTTWAYSWHLCWHCSTKVFPQSFSSISTWFRTLIRLSGKSFGHIAKCQMLQIHFLPLVRKYSGSTLAASVFLLSPKLNALWRLYPQLRLTGQTGTQIAVNYLWVVLLTSTYLQFYSTSFWKM